MTARGSGFVLTDGLREATAEVSADERRDPEQLRVDLRALSASATLLANDASESPEQVSARHAMAVHAHGLAVVATAAPEVDRSVPKALVVPGLVTAPIILIQATDDDHTPKSSRGSLAGARRLTSATSGAAPYSGCTSSCLTLKGLLHLFAALDSTMPVEFPEVEDEDESEDEETKDAKPSTELLNVLTLQCKVANKYESAAKSAEAYALLYEAATHNVQIQRVMKKHKSNFPLAFAGVSHYVTGNLKTAAREIRTRRDAEPSPCQQGDRALCTRRRPRWTWRARRTWRA